MTSLTLAIDTMGGDFGPAVTVPASLQALICCEKLSLILVGDPDSIATHIVGINPLIASRLRIEPANKVISCDAKPSQAIRHSQGSSMRIMLELIRDGQAQACISAGNTGVLMGLATLLLKPFHGIERPALMAIFPHQRRGKTVVLDLGANLDAESPMLVQFAVMGAVLAEEILHLPRPKVALLNIGEEESKGRTVIREAASQLKSMPEINYVGYIEAHDLLTGKVDVLVSDGFSGNVMLKTMEGVLRIFPSWLTASGNKQKWWAALSDYWLKKQWFRRFREINPDQYNGACLIGLCGMVIKSHGAANQYAFATAIKQAEQAVRRRIQERIASRLSAISVRSP